MKIEVKLIDTSLPMPKYHTEGSVAFDMYSRVDMEIEPFKPTLIPLNLIIKVPKGYMFALAARSSLPKKHLFVANGIGTIDQDYHGPEDELKLFVVNFSKEIVKVERGERLCQGILLKIAKAEPFVELKKMAEKSRSGFGSTGKK